MTMAGTFSCMRRSLDQELTFFQHRYDHVHFSLTCVVIFFYRFEVKSALEVNIDP